MTKLNKIKNRKKLKLNHLPHVTSGILFLQNA